MPLRLEGDGEAIADQEQLQAKYTLSVAFMTYSCQAQKMMKQVDPPQRLLDLISNRLVLQPILRVLTPYSRSLCLRAEHGAGALSSLSGTGMFCQPTLGITRGMACVCFLLRIVIYCST